VTDVRPFGMRVFSSCLFGFALTTACTLTPADGRGEGEGDSAGEGEADASGDGEGDAGGEGEGDSGEGEGESELGCLSDARTDSERLLIAMPADSWFEVPSSVFTDFCRPVGYQEPPDDAYRCGNVIEAWGGGVFDHAAQKMIVWGGGHNDYFGNEVYAFNPSTFLWERITAPTPVALDQLSVDPYFDGRPASRHTYDGFAYVDDLGEWFQFGGARAQDGSTALTSWTFNTLSASWTRRADPLPTGAGLYFMGTAYDSFTRQVIARNEGGIYTYFFDDDAWTHAVDFGYPPYYPNLASARSRRGIVLPDERLFISLGGLTNDGLSPDIVAFEIDGFSDVTSSWQTGGDVSVVSRDGAGADYDDRDHSIVAWAGGAPARLDLATKQWTRGSAEGAPAEPVPNGTFGRFRYIKDLNIFILVNRANQNVFFYKNTGGCGVPAG
jgi:hypothetical protein